MGHDKGKGSTVVEFEGKEDVSLVPELLLGGPEGLVGDKEEFLV